MLLAGFADKIQDDVIFSAKSLEISVSPCYNNEAVRDGCYLGVAQMVARYLGVVEAAGSNPVTQTREALENGIKRPFSRAFLLPNLIF